MRASLLNLGLALLVAGLPWASTTPLGRRHAPSPSNLGPLQILYHNSLLSDTSADAAILLEKKTGPKHAPKYCQQIGEQLYPYAEHSPSGLADSVWTQIDFLIHTKQLSSQDHLWVAPNGGSPVPLSISQKKLVHPSSIQQLRYAVLCTDTAAPAVSNSANSTNSGPQQQITVHSGKYSITGTRDRRSFRFLGIPFADAPVGNKRFMHSTPYSGCPVLDATKHGLACPQGFVNATSFPSGEDCLNLNVFTTSLVHHPATTSTKPPLKPVLVFIYGGSFTSGYNSLPNYDGGNMASRGDVVVVTINYRLGMLGFLASGKDLPGNAGISDQILALQWVKKHIEAFGGDPRQITIGGQSAGAQSVSALVSSSAAKGLFRGAIMQSNPWIPFLDRNVYTKQYSPAIAKIFGCPESGSAMVQCLQKIDPVELVKGDKFDAAVKAINPILAAYTNAFANEPAPEPFLPVPDGLIDGHYHVLAANGKLPNKVPTLAGTMAGDGTGFAYGAIPQPLPNNETVLAYALSAAYPPNVTAKILGSGLFPLNASDPDSVRQVMSLVLTYGLFSCPTYEMINLAEKSHNVPKSYLYEFESGYKSDNYEPAVCTAEATGYQACHSSDVREVFGNFDTEGLSVSPAFLNFTRYVTDSWASFVRTLDPNPSLDYLEAKGPSFEYTAQVVHQTPWLEYTTPPFDTQDPRTQILSANNGITRSVLPHRKECDMLRESHAELWQNQPPPQ